ncbi:hypothetical protein GGH20_001141, partial [Coemansia sp. RSA 1937]
KSKEPQSGVDMSVEMADRGYFHNICVPHGCEADCTHVHSTSPTENEYTSTTENDYYMQRYVPPHRRQEDWAAERLRQHQRSSYTRQGQSVAHTRKWYVNIPRWMRLPWTRIALDSDERPPRPVLYAIVLALSVPYFLASLDQTVLSTLTPRVANDQEDLFQTSWVTSSYLASLNAFMLFYGKVADIFGPLPILVIASLIFLCGSVLTATSTNMAWLILARALAGIAAQVPILVVLGSGIGCCIMGLLLTAQVSVRPADLAVTTALATFSQMMGGIMGLAFGSIVLESTTKHHLDRLIDLMPKYATDILRAQNDANEIWTMDVPPNVQQSIIRAYARGLQFNFALITCLGAVAVGLAAFLQGVEQHKAPPPMNGRDDTYASNAGEFSRPGLDLNRLDLDDTTIVW